MEHMRIDVYFPEFSILTFVGGILLAGSITCLIIGSSIAIAGKLQDKNML